MPWLNPTDKALIAKYLLGGLAVGTTTGLASSLINHFKTLNQEAARAGDTSGDDDVLYVNLPRRHGQQKLASAEPEDPSGIGLTMALAGLPLGAIGSHALVNSLYRKHKKRRLQRQLDDVQQVYLDQLSKQANTTADLFKDHTIGAKNVLGYGLPAAAMLTLLASGVLTNKVLDKQFPLAQQPTSTRPKRLVVREAPGEDEGMVKEQSVREEAYEGLLRQALTLEGASHLRDLVKAAASGRTEEILRASDESPDLAFELVKQASSFEVPEVKVDLAIAWLSREPETAPWVKLAAALEFFEHAPSFCALARALPEAAQDAAVKAAADFCRLSRAERYMPHAKEDPVIEKQANSLLEALQDAMEGSDERDPEVVLGNTTSIESTENLQKPTAHARGPRARKFLDSNKDLIDDIFAPEKAGAPALKQV